MKVLFVLTSHNQLGETNAQTGVWLEELANPYYVLKDKGAKISFTSPLGGPPPIDPSSETKERQTKATKRFQMDRVAHVALERSVLLENCVADEYDAVFYPGGHGLLWDLVSNKDSLHLIEQFYAQNKVIAAVCHGVAALCHANTPDGQSLLAGKSVTAFSNSEEHAVKLAAVVPFLLEDVLRAKGVKYSKSEDWQGYVVNDGRLITGQNPASSMLVAKKILALCS